MLLQAHQQARRRSRRVDDRQDACNGQLSAFRVVTWVSDMCKVNVRRECSNGGATNMKLRPGRQRRYVVGESVACCCVAGDAWAVADPESRHCP